VNANHDDVYAGNADEDYPMTMTMITAPPPLLMLLLLLLLLLLKRNA
jgi:hypothetical protein